jgi:SAM-dependent methyltransferase
LTHKNNTELLVVRANALYHDLNVGSFDAIHRLRHRIERRFWEEEVAPRLASAGAQIGVDICTGTGFVPKTLLERLSPETRMLCLDISSETLKKARSQLGVSSNRAVMIGSDATAIPLSNASVDWVSINAGLHHLPKVPATLREIDRILRPGGYFCAGHEPNSRFFSSRWVSRFERVIWYGSWYLSPRRNLARVRRAAKKTCGERCDEEHLGEINQLLMKEGLVHRPLSLEDLRKLVDVHTHSGSSSPAGLSPSRLIREFFSEYEIEVLQFGDYGGEMLRSRPACRGVIDCFGRLLAPGKGMLFSWIIRKPRERFLS